MILGIKTASGLAETVVRPADLSQKVSEPTWEGWPLDRAMSEELLSCIEQHLEWQHVTLQDLVGIIVFRGPGSFTSLRIGITTANALAYALQIPIIGTEVELEDPANFTALAKQAEPQIITPLYGSEPNITKPKK